MKDINSPKAREIKTYRIKVRDNETNVTVVEGIDSEEGIHEFVFKDSRFLRIFDISIDMMNRIYRSKNVDGKARERLMSEIKELSEQLDALKVGITDEGVEQIANLKIASLQDVIQTFVGKRFNYYGTMNTKGNPELKYVGNTFVKLEEDKIEVRHSGESGYSTSRHSIIADSYSLYVNGVDCSAEWRENITELLPESIKEEYKKGYEKFLQDKEQFAGRTDYTFID